MGGPALALLFANHAGAKPRSSLATVFVVVISISFILRVGSGEIVASDFWIAAALLPSLIVGFILGARISPRVDGNGVRVCVLAISALASAVLIVRALLG